MAKRKQGRLFFQKPPMNKPTMQKPKGAELTGDQFLKHIMDSVEKRVRVAELKAQFGVSKIEDRMDIIQANQAVTQYLIGEKGLFTAQEFQSRFETYVEEKLGVVENGKMTGTIFIDFFNVGLAPIETSTVKSHCGKGPIFVE